MRKKVYKVNLFYDKFLKSDVFNNIEIFNKYYTIYNNEQNKRKYNY